MGLLLFVWNKLCIVYFFGLCFCVRYNRNYTLVTTTTLEVYNSIH